MRKPLFYLTALALLVSAGRAYGQSVTQTFQLRNGWNSIWLEVEPTNAEIGTVFASLPLSSVWTYVPQQSTVEFIQDQSEDLFNQPGWLPHFPPQRPEVFLTRLHTVHALKAYLVKLTNGPRTLTITGRPVVRAVKWVPDSFNLRGFPVNPARLPTFNTFFGPSAAHAGQRIYQLRDNGQWTLVTPGELMTHGEAYWAFCAGASTYPGPIGIKLEFGDGLDYGVVLNELVPRACNLDVSPRIVTIQTYPTQPVMPLCRFGIAANRVQWLPLLPTFTFGIDPGAVLDIRTAIKRVDMPTNEMTSVLVVTDDIGTRYLVPVHAQKLGTARPNLAGQPSDNPVAGLWVGTASVTNVNEVNSSQPLRLTPTRSAFDLRLLVHVAPDGANGKPYLLQQVIQMWQNGTTTNDPVSGRAVTDRPGRFVLLTDDSLIPNFRGASLRDGVPVGRRFSTVDFAFSSPTNILPMTGGWGGSQTASCNIELAPNHPTSPFKHRYHPDHDNLDPTYQSFREEAYPIRRQIELQFTPSNPDRNDQTAAALEYGYSVLGGIYRETITGLHRTNITATGTFRLTRVNNAPVLNQ